MALQWIEPEETLRNIGRRKHQGVTPLGYVNVPDRSTFIDGWWWEPVDPESITETGAVKWLQDIKQAGIRPVKVTLRHETTRLLMAPKPAQAAPKAFPYKKLLATALTVSVGIGVAFAGGYVVAALVSAVVSTAIWLINAVAMVAIGLLLLLCLPLALVDPQLCITLSDGTTWIVYRWYSE